MWNISLVKSLKSKRSKKPAADLSAKIRIVEEVSNLRFPFGEAIL